MMICFIHLLHFPNNTQRKTCKTIIKQKTKYIIAIILFNLIELQKFTYTLTKEWPESLTDPHCFYFGFCEHVPSLMEHTLSRILYVHYSSSNVIDVILNHVNNTFSRGSFILPSLKYLHLDEGIFCRVRRLAWCNDPESYAGGSVATGRATLAGQVKGQQPDKERYTGPPGWGLGMRLTTSPR